MNNVLTVAEMRQAEKITMDGGVDVIMLRTSAATAIADGIYQRAHEPKIRTAVFCGCGGNGYDGLLAAGYLKRRGCEVSVYLACDMAVAEEKIGAAIAFAKNEGVEVRSYSDYKYDADIIIDAIFGIGLNKQIDGEIKNLINNLNAQKSAFRLAVDISSGLDGDSGEALGACFKADITVTFSAYKRGMLFGEGREQCGKIVVVDVGVKTSSSVRVYNDADFEPYRRRVDAHKGNAGRIFVIGGCATMVGAPMLTGAAAHAAYLNGAGVVTVCVPSCLKTAVAARAVMATMRFLKDDKNGFVCFDSNALDDIIKHANSIVIGMGMGAAPELKKIIEYLCANFDGSLIIDADALNAMAGDYKILAGSKSKIAITPHVGEFKRLTGKDATIENAQSLAKEIGAVVVLKSATTIITDGDEVRLNITGTPAMAKGGSGDVLAGCITALSCSYPLFDAATVACYRNGKGAERAVSSYAEMMLTPRDILNMADYKEL